MTIALVLPANVEASHVILWTASYASALNESLLVLQYQQSERLPANESDQPNDTLLLATEDRIRELLEGTHPQKEFAVEIKSIRHADPTGVLLDECAKANVSLVILPRYATTKLRSDEFAIERQLFQLAPSAAMQIRLPLPTEPQFNEILVATGSEQSSRFALRSAVSLAKSTTGQVDALFIQPDVGPLAEQVGHERVSTIVNRAFDSPVDEINRRVLVTKDIKQGFQSIRSMNHDLILVGAEYHSVIERKLFSNVAEQLITEPEGPPVAIVRQPMPFQDRMRRRVERLLRRSVPQLDRTQRVKLVEQIQQSSEWDIDFIALIVLSTLIAALGLVQNSTAVVIGAMLVAPLMTPLLGSGLSLIQGNKALARKAAKTVLLGFITAYLLGVFLGLVVPGLVASDEMLARGSPRLPDIIIAFLSGMAAVYAMGRPHLISALPGVAIAASLVPPIATAGLATSIGEFPLAGGSALLFFTNIVAIILGGAACWWVIGFRDAHEYGGFGTWGPRVAYTLLLIAILLGIYESWPTVSLERQAKQAIEKQLSDDNGFTVMNVEFIKQGKDDFLRVTMGAPSAPPVEINQTIMKCLEATELSELPVQIDWHLVWDSRRDRAISDE